MIATDHVNNFFLDNMPAMCMGIADNYGEPATAERRLQVQPTSVRGGGSVAMHLLRSVLQDGVACSFSHHLQLDHSMRIPLSYLMPAGDKAFIPIYQNCVAAPLPPVRSCWALGRALRRAIESLPGDERVAVIGSGGLSHWVGTPEMGQINEDWDRQLLDLLANGNSSQLADWSDAQIEPAGNGAHEIRNWATALGAAEGARVEVLAYEPVHEWLTGIAVCDVVLSRAGAHP